MNVLNCSDLGGNGFGLPGSGRGGFTFSFNGGAMPCDSDFVPCGLPEPTLGETFGLPTLSCPAWMGPLCGGINPAMDAGAANNGQQPQSLAQQQCKAAQQQAQNNFNAINRGFYQKAYKSALKGILWGGAAGCLITSEIGCAEGGLPLALIGGLGGAAKSMAEDVIYETVDTIQANEACEGVQ